jgi:predicted MFS family arabinose efflux permease
MGSDTQSATAIGTAGAQPDTSEARLPWVALLALALAGFVGIMTETLPAGLLPQIADGLGVSEALAGQWVTVYAAGSLVAAIPAVTLTRGMRRKPLLLIAVSGFLVANTATVISPWYVLALGARLVAGMFSGLLWGILVGYARKLVPEHLTGRALAVAMVGTPVALSIGTPLGTFAGGVLGWRWAFGAMSLLSVVLVVWVTLAVPDAPGQPAATRMRIQRVLALPGIVPILAVTFGWMLAHNLLYTYIAPYVASTELGVRVDVTLLVFGITALVGLWVTGIYVDRALRKLALGSLAGFATVTLLLGLFGSLAVPFWVSIVGWGLAFGGAATQLQTALADAAGDNGDVAQATLVTVWNFAMVVGGTAGGVVLAGAGAGVFPWLVSVLALATLGIVATAGRVGFAPGERTPLSASAPPAE